MLNRAMLTDSGHWVVPATLGVVLLALGGVLANEAWPESTSTTGDCVRAVRCPSLTVESGSAAWAFVGCVLGLVGVVLVLTASRSAIRHHRAPA